MSPYLFAIYLQWELGWTFLSTIPQLLTIMINNKTIKLNRPTEFMMTYKSHKWMHIPKPRCNSCIFSFRIHQKIKKQTHYTPYWNTNILNHLFSAGFHFNTQPISENISKYINKLSRDRILVRDWSIESLSGVVDSMTDI